MARTLKVYHFAADMLRDGSPLPKKGDKLPRIAKPVPCERGWHGSVRIVDALKYAPGTNLSVRVLSGTIIAHEDDKHCASVATMATEYRDVRDVLIRFARWTALRAIRIHAADALEKAGLREHAATLCALPDDCDLRAAARSARSARSAAWSAESARSAAWSARSAAESAWSAARSARSAAWSARSAAESARSAAESARSAAAECDMQNEWLTREVSELLK